MTNNSRRTHASVLVVEDDRANQRLLMQLLTREDYRVHVAENGEDALVALDAQAPDLIILDVRLPGINGFEVCRRIKHNPATRFTPVVLITGFHNREQRIEGINAGADDFL